jgi:hypothetical protein
MEQPGTAGSDGVPKSAVDMQKMRGPRSSRHWHDGSVHRIWQWCGWRVSSEMKYSDGESGAGQGRKLFEGSRIAMQITGQSKNNIWVDHGRIRSEIRRTHYVKRMIPSFELSVEVKPESSLYTGSKCRV